MPDTLQQCFLIIMPERTGEDSPSKILTILSISNQVIAVIGPTLGGILVASGGWQSIL